MNYISKYIPFSYLWVFRNAVGNNVETMLDIGCGDGNFTKDLAICEQWKITGVDIYPKSLEKARKTGVYVKLVEGNVITVAKNLISKKQKFDLVFCSAILEHLSKNDGLAFIKLVDKLATKKIIFGTPNGFMNNPEEFLEENEYQEHKSGWTKEEFALFGYKVYGAGLRPVWAEYGLARNKNRWVSIFSRMLSLASSPMLYYFPSLSADLVAVKTCGK